MEPPPEPAAETPGPAEALQEQPPTPAGQTPRLRISAPWAIAAGVVLAVACTLLVWVFQPAWWRLVGYFWYSIPANTFLHLPYDPAVVYTGSLYSPWMVALMGGTAAVAGDAIDYIAIKRLFRVNKLARAKEAALYKKAVRCFRWRPWVTVAAFALGPLPYDVIRVLAPTSDYPFWRYASATFVGRASRFYLLALGGAWLTVSPVYLAPAMLLVLVLPLAVVAWSRSAGLRRRVRAYATAGSLRRRLPQPVNPPGTGYVCWLPVARLEERHP